MIMMSSEIVQARDKKFFMAMEPTTTTITTTTTGSCSKTNQTANNSTSSYLFLDQNNNNNRVIRRNIIVKQFDGNPKQQTSDQQQRYQIDNDNTDTQVEEVTNDQSADDNKHHVGPLGIFFKVWSLVKVTKVRHQQKMRRQNSEDTGHRFQYLVAEQPLASGSGGYHQQPTRGFAGILQDRHFRRAGSQPASSISSGSPPHLAIGHSSNNNRLQVSTKAASALTTSALCSQSPSATATSSTTSSGVSSTGSFCAGSGAKLNIHNRNSSDQASGRQLPAPTGSSVRRHLSAYNLGQQQEPAPAVQSSAPPSKSHGQIRSKLSSGASNWATKIRRSATTVNQTDFSSYVSRYRSRRDRPPAAGNEQQNRKSGAVQATNSQESDQVTPLQSDYDDEYDCEDYDCGQEKMMFRSGNLNISSPKGKEEFELRDTMCEEDGDTTSNDIYSTPNDSIQSVPCGQRAPTMISANDEQQPLPPPSSRNPMPKSFSANDQRQMFTSDSRQPTNKFGPLKEAAGDGSGGEPEVGGQSKEHPSNRQRINSSRFFISSSSSEDSQSAQTAAAAATAQVQSVAPTSGCQVNYSQQPNQYPVSVVQQTSLDLQQQQQLNLQQGVHCHRTGNGSAHPPSSLLMRSPTSDYAVPMSSFPQPASRGQLAQLSSPLDCLPIAARLQQQQQQPLLCNRPLSSTTYLRSGYRKSPSLLEISSHASKSSRFSSKYPIQHQMAPPVQAAAKIIENNEADEQQQKAAKIQLKPSIPNSISLHDCKQQDVNKGNQEDRFKRPELPAKHSYLVNEMQQTERQHSDSLLRNELMDSPWAQQVAANSEYKLAQMLLGCGSNPNATKDSEGNTALMHAVLSDNLAAVQCLVEHGAQLDAVNQAGDSALDLLCSRPPTRARLEILKLLVDRRANLDMTKERDGSRLLDRLIGDHNHSMGNDKLPFIDFLLQSGAKLGSATWLAAADKQDIQLRLLRKLCQDGYYLYKKSSIEAAVYRFEYALRRIAELEQQLAVANSSGCRRSVVRFVDNQFIPVAAKQLKYQTYLGLSRCERKRKFYKRALEFAHLAILVDSTSYEGFYSKAHILKDLGELDDALLTIDQTQRLVASSIESLELELEELRQEEEAQIFDGCFNMLDPRRSNWIETNRLELSGNLDYMHEARKFVSRLRVEILDDRLKTNGTGDRCEEENSWPLVDSKAQTTSCNDNNKLPAPIAI